MLWAELTLDLRFVTRYSLPTNPQFHGRILLITSFNKNHDAWELAAGLLWKQVVLEDCRTTHEVTHEEFAHEWFKKSSDTPSLPERLVTDEHDDTPIIQKLLVIAR